MLRIDDTQRRLISLEDRDLQSERLLERTDIQEMICGSWDAFSRELGFPSLRLVGSEVRPHESVGDRIDILAFDEDDGVPVIIELKRDRHKLHLLQALSYCAMVSNWDSDRLRQELGQDADDELINSIDNLDEDQSPRIILIAEEFDPEVILTTDWLSRLHGVDISCFTLSVQRHDEQRFVRIQLSYPLPELEQIYRARRSAPARQRQESTQSWEEVKQWVDAPWVAHLIDLLRNLKEGHPGRRRFGSLFANDWGSYIFMIQKRGANVYILGRREGDLEYWEKELPSAAVNSWGNEASKTQGLRIKLASLEASAEFLRTVGQGELANTLLEAPRT